ncbi:MAG: NAD(P)H-dependent oxidoreductase subunit E [Alphaproteobacteria bacterium GM202ARS2]|nr:NAD(P)H-dependent oxidoreductase subunit E [Alphaproteobacteria bacterium GM202ARS2]
MSENQQLPESFATELESLYRRLQPKYPSVGQNSAVLPLLHHAQQLCGGWLPKAAMDHVARLLDMAPIRVYEVVTFHTMFHTKPMPKHCVGVCTSLPCWLRGADKLMAHCRARLGVRHEEGISADDNVYLMEQECLGACVDAPLVTVDGVYHGRLDEEAVDKLLRSLREDNHVGS